MPFLPETKTIYDEVIHVPLPRPTIIPRSLFSSTSNHTQSIPTLSAFDIIENALHLIEDDNTFEDEVLRKSQKRQKGSLASPSCRQSRKTGASTSRSTSTILSEAILLLQESEERNQSNSKPILQGTK